MAESRKNEVSTLGVFLGGRRIGVMVRLNPERNHFAFDEDYIEDENRPTLSLSFKTESGGLATDMRPVNKRVAPFFSNLLPEGPLRQYLAERSGVNPEREFFLLHALGLDLPGAVTVAPIDAGIAYGELGQTEDADPIRGEHGLRFSLAGVQLKFSAVMESAGGLTIPARGIGGSWIVKLPSMQFPLVPENEFVMMELARRIGVSVPQVRLVRVREIAGLPEDVGALEGNALAVERFDRLPDGTRVHIEDFAQVFGIYPERKYERKSYANIASVLAAEAGAEAVNDFMRRLAFSVLIGNGDMHLKNWSLIYRDGRTASLSPAYDLLATLPYIPDDELALSLGRSRSIASLTREQVRRFADKAGLAINPLWLVVEETIERTLESWRVHDAREILPSEMRDGLESHMEKVARRTLGNAAED